MKIKINWGTGILIAIIIFISFILFMVFQTTRQDHSLVMDDYYEQSFRYNEKLHKLENTEKLEEKVKIAKSTDFVVITFPEIFIPDSIIGTIQFYHPSTSAYDKKMTIKCDEKGKVYYPLQDLKKAKYAIKLDYIYRTIPYYQEESLFINMNF